MPFEKVGLNAIAEEIRRRQVDAGRLSLVTFDEEEYNVLHQYAQRIVREYNRWHWPYQKRDARLIFLAFTMAFVRRHKYTDDNVFWPDFEKELGLESMERRSLMMNDLFWPAYEEEGIERSRDKRGRRIVGTLIDEMGQAKTWITQARNQFVALFQWYYRHFPEADITPQLLDAYRRKTGSELQALDKVLPTLTRDCQALARVIDFAIEEGLYLQASQLDEYRQQIIAALGPEYDPVRLRLIRDERTLIRLILELQNHHTSAQFVRRLRERRSGTVCSPWGKQLVVHQALKRWSPFAYGIYQVDGENYRVVPHPRLRLEMLDEWPWETVVQWKGERYLGYKKRSSFDVTIGRRIVEATPYYRRRHDKQYIWVGEVPIGQKLSIDGRLRPESAGADWTVALRLHEAETDRPGMVIAITRLMLYYPHRKFQPLRVWASTGYQHEDSLREDGVRRFHLHRDLIIPLDTFEQPVEVGVQVGDEGMLDKRFEPEPYYLFSVISRERVQEREVADLGDREYILFARGDAFPKAGPGVSVQRLPVPYGAYTVYRVVWEDAAHPFDLHVGPAQWSFRHRREFAILLDAGSSPPYINLKSHQCLRFQDLSLRLYSTFNLIKRVPTLEVSDDEGPLGDIDLLPYLRISEMTHFFDIDSAIWEQVEAMTEGRYGRYRFCFRKEDTFLGERVVALMPLPILEDWDEEQPHLESEPIGLTVASPECPVWDPNTQQTRDRAKLALRPRTQAEPWEEKRPLRQIVPVPLSTPVSFPEIGETLEVLVHPRLFGHRLYLKRSERTSDKKWRTIYQPLSQADYYQLNQTVLYVFSAPHSRVEIRQGLRHAKAAETDAEGNLLIDSLDFLQSICLAEETVITLQSEGLETEFVVRWAPLLKKLTVDDQIVTVCYNGPEGTAVRLSLCVPSGEELWKKDLHCRGEAVTDRVPLPTIRSPVAYLIAGYVLESGEVRSAAWQLAIEGESAHRIPEDWLLQGVGVIALEDLS